MKLRKWPPLRFFWNFTRMFSLKFWRFWCKSLKCPVGIKWFLSCLKIIEFIYLDFRPKIYLPFKFFDNTGSGLSFSTVKEHSFVLCKFNNQLWTGKVTAKDFSSNEISISFMHPPYQGNQVFRWPRREDRCWVPATTVKLVLNDPTTVSGEDYVFSGEEITAIACEAATQ